MTSRLTSVPGDSRTLRIFVRSVKPQSGRGALTWGNPVNVNAPLQAVVTLLEPQWQPAGVHFDLKLDSTCPQLSADEELLRHAFLNILIVQMHDGTIRSSGPRPVARSG